MDNPDPTLFSTRTLNLLDIPIKDPLEYRSRVLGRISELEAELLAMRKAHNDASPIFRLPPELFTNIFKRLIMQWGIPREKAAWLLQVNVCHRWRQLVLSRGDLWSNLLLTREDLTWEMIIRSRSTPLNVDLAWGWKSSLDVLRMAVAPTQRLQSVSLSAPFGSGKWPEDELDHWTHQELPMLKDLSLRNSEHYYGNPPKFKSFPQKAPCLRRLVVQDLTISWGEVPFGSNIVNLRLSQNRELLNRPSWKDFLRSFSDMKRLETLDLEGFLPLGQPNSPEMTGSAPCPELPRIKFLRIVDFLQPAGVFFEAVSYPATALVDVDLVVQNQDGDIAALHTFDYLLGNPNHPVFKQLRIWTKSPYGGHEFHFWGNTVEDLRSKFQFDQEKPERSIRVKTSDGFRGSSDHIVTAVLKNYDLGPIESMIVHGNDRDDTGLDWTALSSSMNGTRTILCNRMTILPFLQAIAGSKTFAGVTDVEGQEGSSGAHPYLPESHPVLFPSLDTLILSHSSFGPPIRRRVNLDTSLEFANDVALLVEALKNRSAVRPISTIVFQDCRNFRDREKERVEAAAKGSIVQWVSC